MNDLVFELGVELALDSLAALDSHVASALAGRRWPAVQWLESPLTLKRGAPLPASPVASLEELVAGLDRFAKDPTDVRMLFSKRSVLAFGRRPDGKSYNVTLRFVLSEGILDDPHSAVEAQIHFARGLLARGAVMTAAIDRPGDPGPCVPFVPLAKARRPLILTDDAEVAEAYDDPDAFWSAGWTIEKFGTKTLLTRCHRAITLGEVIAETIDDQWQMARAAKPKRTFYGPPIIAPDERPVFERGAPTLTQIGVDSQGLIEFSCWLEPGDHIRGYEIYYLEELVREKRTREGQAVSTVRVVFYPQHIAECEKRPLLDLGVLVYYTDPETGDIVQVT